MVAKTAQLPLNAWILYRMRFMFTADLCGDWALFGGSTAQLNNLSISTHLDATERIATSFLYGNLPPDRLG